MLFDLIQIEKWLYKMLFDLIQIENRLYTMLFDFIQIENRLYNMLFDSIQIENLVVFDAFPFNTLSKQELKKCCVSKFMLKNGPRYVMRG